MKTFCFFTANILLLCVLATLFFPFIAALTEIASGSNCLLDSSSKDATTGSLEPKSSDEVKDAANYIQDLKHQLEKLVKKRNPRQYYRIGHELGSGNRGTVYKCWRKSDNKIVYFYYFPI